MARLQVKCVDKTNRSDPHERISYIGGDGWKQAEDDAIYDIEHSNNSYYVHRGGYEVDVIVATRLGHKYLKTRNDGEQPDNLLALPECP
jgi:Protein of unknown function (DUF3892)